MWFVSCDFVAITSQLRRLHPLGCDTNKVRMLQKAGCREYSRRLQNKMMKLKEIEKDREAIDKKVEGYLKRLKY